MVDQRPHVGFVLERALGHATHADNLSRLVPLDDRVDAAIATIPYEVTGAAARVPGYGSNWTVRAGLRARSEIRRMQAERRLDALFVNTQVPAVLNVSWLRRIPTIVSLDATPLQYDELGEFYGHQPGNARAEDLKRRLNRSCYDAAVHLVAWSEWTKQGLVEGYGVRPGKVSVVAPGIDPSLWAPSGPPPEGPPVRILFVGGDLARKGGDVLLEAFGRLRADLEAHGRGDEVELHLVTRSEVPPTPGVQVHTGLGPNDPRLIELYHRSHVFCLPTRGDALPLVLSEAGAAGLPVVSTAVAAIPEIVRDGETGLVVPVGDAGALEHALATLVADADVRLRLGAGARALVAERYDAAKNARRLVDLLLTVASGRVPAA